MISRTVAGAVAAGVAGGVYRALRARPHQRWQRTNYAGRAVDLYAGPAAALGAAAGAAVLPLPPRARTAAALAVLAAGGAVRTTTSPGPTIRAAGSALI